MNDQAIALIRTAWQGVVAAFLAWLLSEFAIDIDTTAAMAVTWPIVLAVYYAVARAIGDRIPGLDKMLLGPGPNPTYSDE